MNEDVLVLKSNINRKRKDEKKQNLKYRFNNIIEAMKIIFERYKPKHVSITRMILNKFIKTILLLLTITIIIIIHYFYIYWHLIPMLESTESGFTFNFFDNWYDYTYRKGIILFTSYHLLLILFIISLLRTIWSNPGHISNEYDNIYSIPRFIKNIFLYIMNYKDSISDFIFDHKTSLLEDVEFIINSEINFNEKLLDIMNFSEYNSRYNSIDISNKKSGISDKEETEREKSSSTTIDDVFESYEIEFEKFITSSDIYNFYTNLNFFERDSRSHRFCSFCLHKKPDRAHHCRQCKKCIRKMDHHCMFLYTCIGYDNYKYFFLMLFYSSCILVLISVSLIDGVKFYINEYRDNFYFVAFCSFYGFIIGLTSFLLYFLYLHSSLLINNLTTIDLIEKEESNVIGKNLYDLGKYNNICLVMGPIYTWLLPIRFTDLYKGYHYPINMKVLEDIKNSRNRYKDEIRKKFHKYYNTIK